MAFKHGMSAELLIGGLDLTGYFRSLDFSADVDTAETTTFGKDWKTFLPGVAEATYEAEGLYDPAIVDDMEGLLSTSPIVTVGPAGLRAAGDRARLIQSISTAYGESSPVGDAVVMTWETTTDQPVGLGHVIARGAITADANGATYDGGGATTTGAIAHLHVTDVSASDSIVVTIEDASVPSGGGANWATIGTFASKSAIGAERLVIAGTIRRYLRAVYDVTGSSVSISVAVAVART